MFLSRLLELSGIKTLLEHNLNPNQAKKVFLDFNVPEDAFADSNTLKNAWKGLVRKYHTDHGGDHEKIALVNAAYDVLKKPGVLDALLRAKSPRDFNGDDDDDGSVPPWAWAGYSGGSPPSSRIYREDYTDLNFIKKTMWKLSGQSTEQWTVWAFDGHFFRGSFTVFGNSSIFKDMIDAMYTWNSHGANSYKTRAIFVSRYNKYRPSEEMDLIWADGFSYADHPIKFEFDSFNSNPSNDQYFVRSLPEKLDELLAKIKR